MPHRDHRRRRPVPPTHEDVTVDADGQLHPQVRATTSKTRPPDHSSGVHAADYQFAVARADGGVEQRSLTAAAQVLQDNRIQRRLPMPKGSQHGRDWQKSAWELYEEVGELHFAIQWAANMLSKCRLIAARVGDDGQPYAIDPTDDEDLEPEPDATQAIDGAPAPDATEPDHVGQVAAELVANFAGGPAGQAQFLVRAGQHLQVAGESWIVVRDDPETAPPPQDADSEVPRVTTLQPVTPLTRAADEDALADAEDSSGPRPELVRAYSSEEVGAQGGSGGKWWVDEGNGKEPIPDEALVIRCWRPHPLKFQWSDSAIHAALPVLRELKALTMHVSAQVDSRLAGAGILVLPESVKLPGAKGPSGTPDILKELTRFMVVPIQDRDDASAVVPFLLTVGDDAAGKIQHIRFSTPLDAEAKNLRDEALRRTALALDMPPEVLLGLSSLNHWSAWLSDESAIKISTAPLAGLICHALTVGWLRPLLLESGVPPEEADQIMVWFDTAALEMRPDRSGAARELHADGIVSDESVRRENGFTDADAPSTEERNRRLLEKLLLAKPDFAPVILPVLGIEIDAFALAAVAAPTPAAEPAAPEPSGGAADDEPAPGGGRSLPDRADAPPEAEGDQPEPVAASARPIVLNVTNPSGLDGAKLREALAAATAKGVRV